MKDKFLEAQDRQKNNADKSRKEHPMIMVENKVRLLCRNLKIDCPCNKLNFRCFGSFLVIKQINDVAFRLKLPPPMKIHQVLHASLLEPYNKSSIPNRY
jgi:hypothetical protein